MFRVTTTQSTQTLILYIYLQTDSGYLRYDIRLQSYKNQKIKVTSE